MHKPGSMPAAMAASLVAIVAVAGVVPSRAAADTCLTAPNGPTPKGQHWYYHLDHAKNRKCWYLRAANGAATPAVAASPTETPAPPPKASVAAAPARPAASSQPPASAPTPPVSAAVSAPPAADAGAVVTGAPPASPQAPVTADGAQNAGSVWPDASPTAGAAVQQAEAAPSAVTTAVTPPATTGAVSTAPPPAAADAAPSPAPVTTRSAQSAAPAIVQSARTAAPETPPAAAPADTASHPFVETALAGLLAAVLALGVFAIGFVMLRRKRVRAEPADVVIPRFGSKSARRDGGLFKLPDREAPPLQAGPIRSSLIPEQVSLSRVPRR